MSGYFGALMRSSGMAIGGRTPAVDQPIAPDRVADPLAQLASPPPVRPQTDAEAARAELTAPARGTLRRGVSPAAAPSAAERVGAMVQPVIGQAGGSERTGELMVRAAMQWVAAQPQPIRSLAPIEPPHGRIDNEAGAPDSARTDGDPAATVPGPASPTPADPVPDRSVPESVVMQALTDRSARPSATTPASSGIGPRDELVEISIGTIQVRVDAPTTQTVARVTTPTAAAAPRRSGLSRRALRRL